MPGVPGIGVKTAAQLIGEYGDLETLLKRASEIKQEKRRQSLIENAEKARLSKKLVTLDDHVKLDVPIGDLAVHEPDHKRLIAFLKAMEFNVLTRRVAEFSSIDAGEIEPDARLAAGGALPSPLAGEGGEARRASPGEGPSAEQTALTRPAAPAALSRKGRGEGANGALTPQALAAARVDAAHSQKFDRSQYETVRSLERLKTWIDRARDLGFLAIDTETTSSRSDAGGAVRVFACGGAQSGLLCPAQPSAGRRRAMAACFKARWRPTKSPNARPLRR